MNDRKEQRENFSTDLFALLLHMYFEVRENMNNDRGERI